MSLNISMIRQYIAITVNSSKVYGITHTSTPVECKGLCQFTGRNSTLPIC